MRMENRAILLTNLTFTFTKSGEKQPKNAEEEDCGAVGRAQLLKS